MPTDGVGQWLQKRRRLADRVGQGRAVQVQPVALEDLALPVEREVIGVFVDQHVRQQAGPGTTALDGTGRQRRLGEGLAARTGEAGPDDPVHDEPARHVLQFFRYIFAQTPQRTTALGAVVVAGGEFDFHPRNVIGDRPALRLVLLLVGKPQLRGHLGDRDLARLERQLELLDGLRRRAEPMAAVTRQLMPELLDQHRLRLHFRQQERREAPQIARVFRQGLGGVEHAKA